MGSYKIVRKKRRATVGEPVFLRSGKLTSSTLGRESAMLKQA